MAPVLGGPLFLVGPDLGGPLFLVGPCSWWTPVLGGPLGFSLVSLMDNAALTLCWRRYWDANPVPTSPLANDITTAPSGHAATHMGHFFYRRNHSHAPYLRQIYLHGWPPPPPLTPGLRVFVTDLPHGDLCNYFAISSAVWLCQGTSVMTSETKRNVHKKKLCPERGLTGNGHVGFGAKSVESWTVSTLSYLRKQDHSGANLSRLLFSG